MRNEEAIMKIQRHKNEYLDKYVDFSGIAEALDTGIQALKDIEEIREVMSCDADAANKCKMISNILTAKPHYFKK